MNDYLGTSHEAIYDMVRKGEPGQSRGWATDVTGIGRDLGAHLASLREQCALIASVWSDGVGSVRLTADLGAVIDYLQVLADGLSGQSASYSNLTVQAAADLAAAQPPSALPPPPALSIADLSVKAQQINSSPVAPEVKDLQVAQVGRQIAANHADWIKAGETATALDNEYRTALARLTPPPEPPPIVLDAATAGGAVGPAAAPEAVAASGLSGGGSIARGTSPVGGWSVDRYLPGGPGAGAGAGQSVSAGSLPGSFQPVGAVESTGSGGGPVLAGSDLPAVRAGSGVITAGTLSGGGGAVPGSARPHVDPVTLHGGIWDGSVGAGAAGLGVNGMGAGHPAAGQSAAGLLADGSFAGSGPAGAGFDPVTGSAITAGPARVASALGSGGSGWESAAGVGGIAALAAGAVMLSRGGPAAVTAAGLSGGFGAGGNGAGTFGGPGSGSGVGGSAPGSAGAANTAAGSARGIIPGVPGSGSTSMVQGGQIGQTGRPVSCGVGAGVGRPGAPGSGIGGEHGYRVTWLVEDRDLYGRGPSVKSVIESAPDVE